MKISIDLLIETWIQINNFILKMVLWFFINIKTHLLVIIDFWSQKIWISHLIGPSQNEIFYIDSHFKFVIGIQYMM